MKHLLAELNQPRAGVADEPEDPIPGWVGLGRAIEEWWSEAKNRLRWVSVKGPHDGDRCGRRFETNAFRGGRRFTLEKD
jgi:hypothetical protein